MVLAQSQSSSGNYIVVGHAIILDPTRQLTKPMAVATQPNQDPCPAANLTSPY
jgi:hypothetical protein